MTMTEDRELNKKERKQLRARARRAQKTKKIRQLEKAISETYKPITEWDDEELARGRPRCVDGTFRGPAPSYITRDVHEEAISRFKDVASSDLRALVPTALMTVKMLLESEATDDKDHPLVPPSVKLQAAQWVVEHLVGKPTQRTEMDISVKLQAVLAGVMVTEEASSEGLRQLMPSIDPVYREIVEGETEET